MNKSTWRESRIFVPSQKVYEHTFIDTKPNYVVLANNSGANLYFALSRLVSATNFDMIVPPYGRKIYARDQSFDKIFLYTEGPDGAYVHVTSFYSEFNPAHISQTQEIVGTSATGLLGIIDVNKILTPLPSGTNKIGSVDIASINVSLPAGSNKIGIVDVDTIPPIPAGSNKIGKVDVDTLPPISGNVSLDVVSEIILLPSEARTSTQNVTVLNKGCRGIKLIIDITAITGAPSIIAKIKGIDPASTKEFDMLSSVALNAVGTTILTVYPGITPVTNQKADDVLPRNVKIVIEHLNTDSITYSVGAILLP